MENNILDKITEAYDEDGNKGILLVQFDLNLDEGRIITTNLGNYGGIKIYIYPEKSYPKAHIHLICNKFKKGDAIILLEKNYHWPHEKHRTIIDKGMAEDLDKILRQKYKDDPRYTNWEYAVYFWNLNHNNKIKIKEQPDYTQVYKNIE